MTSCSVTWLNLQISFHSQWGNVAPYRTHRGPVHVRLSVFNHEDKQAEWGDKTEESFSSSLLSKGHKENKDKNYMRLISCLWISNLQHPTRFIRRNLFSSCRWCIFLPWVRTCPLFKQYNLCSFLPADTITITAFLFEKGLIKFFPCLSYFLLWHHRPAFQSAVNSFCRPAPFEAFLRGAFMDLLPKAAVTMSANRTERTNTERTMWKLCCDWLIVALDGRLNAQQGVFTTLSYQQSPWAAGTKPRPADTPGHLPTDKADNSVLIQAHISLTHDVIRRGSWHDAAALVQQWNTDCHMADRKLRPSSIVTLSDSDTKKRRVPPKNLQHTERVFKERWFVFNNQMDQLCLFSPHQNSLM